MESVGEYEYNTKDLIGHGAFAVVFKGRSKKNSNSVVAIKSITKKNLSKSQNLLGKEIKILKELTELHHENVVALLDCKETPHHVYLVMEYCNGGDLADYLQIKGTLSEDTIRLFLRQLAGAMRALNAKGIVHRDLKPQNILLCHSSKTNPTPNEIRLKIADFGFARFLQDGVMAATLCGSPMYMAPEVIMSLQYDAKADLWSIGTIVFQCLTGKAPFQAQTPQALKQFYEKNVNLSPKIPHGTSAELADLLMRLLKRNARDRLEFDDFFCHPFLKKVVKPTSPVPVPARQRSHSREVSPVKLLAESPLSGIVPLCAAENFEELRHVEMAGAALGSPHTDGERFSPVAKGHISPVIEEHDDFVLVSTTLQSHISYENVVGVNNKRKSSDPYGSPILTGGTPPTKFSTVGISSSADSSLHHGRRHSPPSRDSLLPRPTDLHVPNSPSSNLTAANKSEPIPVPSQKEAYQQIQQSLRESPVSPCRLVAMEDPCCNKDIHMVPVSPASPCRSPKYWETAPTGASALQPVTVRRDSTESLNRMTPDISSMSPPSVQFLIGTPPTLGQRGRGNTNTPPPGNPWQSPLHHLVSAQQMASTSPLSRASLNSPPLNGNYCIGSSTLPSVLRPTASQPSHLFNCNSLFPNLAPTLDGNNSLTSPSQPLVMPFGTRAHTLPELSSKDPVFDPCVKDASTAEAPLLCRSGSTGRLSDALGNFEGAYGVSPKGFSDENASPNSVMPYGRTSYMFGPEANYGSPYKSPFSKPMLKTSTSGGNHHLHFGTSPPNMEGPICFVAPELPQETLMEREHNETLAKLNFVSALVDCIIELAKTRSMPIVALTDSTMYQENNSSEQLQCVVSESYKKAEQLVLYVRALQMLSSSLNMSKEELRSGRLRPSNLVKNVVSNMNEKYHFCLEMCKSLKSPNLLHSVRSDPQTSSITAEKLLYNYAIQMCQAAALDELFGNPEECFQRYQTAQILLHSLGQQISNDDDKHLLNKYKEAVEKRLYVLQQQGYIYAYDTSCTT